MEQEIIKLTDIWYKLVSLDHHKDRDCHWSIYKTYSYGQPARYRVEHAGYVWKDYSEEFGTSGEAHEGLIAALNEAIADEVDWAQKVLLSDPKEWDEYQIENAKKVLEIAPKEPKNIKNHGDR